MLFFYVERAGKRMNMNKNLMSRNHEALKRTAKDIQWLVFHYVGALGDAKENTEYYKNTNLNASADFWVGFAGDIWQGNDYWNYYSWAIGGGLQGSGPHPYFQIAKNSNSVSVEMCVRKRSTGTMNATDRDWYFEDATVESAAELGAHLMKELDIDIDHVIRHYDVNAKVCPNPFVYDTGKTSWAGFKKKIMSYYNGSAHAADDIWMGWTKYESGSAGFRQVAGDKGHAYGKYQFDYRYGLVPFMQSCVAHNPGRYLGFNKYISMGAGNSKLIGNAGLTAVWLELCDKYPKEFEQLQDAAAKRDYYVPVKTFLQKKGINLDNHDPAVRGSAFSMSIRSGASSAAEKFNGCKDSDTDKSILKRIYGTYGNEDAGRWPRQLAEALDALGGTQTVPEPEPNPEPDKTGSYKVQAGSYSNKKNAEKQAAVIAGKGFQAIVKAESGQYKVQCGSFASRKNANALVGSLKAAGVDAIVKGTEDSAWVGKCTGDGVNVRKGPGTNYGTIAGYPKLNTGNLVDVINKESGWYQILIDKKYSGFVSTEYIEKA